METQDLGLLNEHKNKKKMKTNKHKKGKARKYFIKTFIIFKKSLHRKKSKNVNLLTAKQNIDTMKTKR